MVGDATGKVHLLEFDDDDDRSDAESETTSAPFLVSAILGKGSNVLVSHPEPHYAPLRVKKPKVIIPHPEPPPPADFKLEAEDEELETAQDIAQSYISEGALAIYDAIGAIQSHNYAKTAFFEKRLMRIMTRLTLASSLPSEATISDPKAGRSAEASMFARNHELRSIITRTKFEPGSRLRSAVIVGGAEAGWGGSGFRACEEL